MGLHDRHYAQTQPGYGGGGGVGLGRFGSGPGHPRQWSANTWIIVICIAVFVIDALMYSSGVFYSTEVGRQITPNPDGTSQVVSVRQDLPIFKAWFHFSTAKGLFGLEIWRFIGFQFIHANMNHLLFNMLGLFFFGGMVERYLGKKRYVAYYLLTGVCGALFYLLLNLMG
ncbi:MAG: rhomboid family intramembrane serine protease, partial [Planctomycetota bacterium]